MNPADKDSTYCQKCGQKTNLRSVFAVVGGRKEIIKICAGCCKKRKQ